MDLKEARINRAARHPWELARLEMVASLLRRHLPAPERGLRRILDIGCGDAWVVEQLAERFPQSDFLAIDQALNDLEITSLRARLSGAPVAIYRHLEETDDREPSALDMVLMLDVLEHMEDDEGFLARLRHRPRIAAETKLLITVPAWQALFCSHDEFLGHYRRYNSRILCERLERSGFQVLERGYFFSGLVGLRYAQVVAERLGLLRLTASGIGREKSSPVLDRLLKAGLLLDGKFGAALRKLGLDLPGLSVFAVATAGACRPKMAK